MLKEVFHRCRDSDRKLSNVDEDVSVIASKLFILCIMRLSRIFHLFQWLQTLTWTPVKKKSKNKKTRKVIYFGFKFPVVWQKFIVPT